MWIWLVIWIVILVFNTVHSFLPNKLQGKKWIRITAMIIASLILIRGLVQEVAAVRDRSSAYISADGEIIEKRNFPWKITKTSAPNITTYVNELPRRKRTGYPFEEDSSLYRRKRRGIQPKEIEERYGDATEVEVEPDRHVRFEVCNAIDGVAVKFFCESEEVPSFRVRIDP